MPPPARDTGASAPLLPELDSPPRERGASVPGAVFNVSTSIIGAGIMSIPATLRVLGVVPAFVLIVLVAVLVDVSVEFMLRFTYSGESKTYAGLMRESFGRLGSVAVQICVMITNLGCLIIYLIIIGDVLSGNQPEGALHLGVLQEWFGIHWWNSRAVALLFIVVVIEVQFSSLGSPSSGVRRNMLSDGNLCTAGRENKESKTVTQLDNQASYFNLFTAVPVIVTAFTFHFNDSIISDILVNFDEDSSSTIGSLLNDVVRLSYALHLMLVFPLLNFSLRTNIDELLFPKRPLPASDTRRFVALTLVLLAFAYLAAIAIPNIWYFFQFMGPTSAVCLAFIFPGAIALSIKDKGFPIIPHAQEGAHFTSRIKYTLSISHVEASNLRSSNLFSKSNLCFTSSASSMESGVDLMIEIAPALCKAPTASSAESENSTAVNQARPRK
ncbi:hypothetical protein RJ639_005414 [Escallonia herrerae]|uniref:Amino acid transporter transmembrane domain-containing protein n=1 Tax=Escallonia herrerae TaxID=1293975 RepID=A0AA88VVI2_9ASTE|nr:hypothetical protein RJ639_005414 [Escallonia herrerae]